MQLCASNIEQAHHIYNVLYDEYSRGGAFDVPMQDTIKATHQHSVFLSAGSVGVHWTLHCWLDGICGWFWTVDQVVS